MRRIEVSRRQRKEIIGEGGLNVQELKERTKACVNVGRDGAEANVVEVLRQVAQVQAYMCAP